MDLHEVISTINKDEKDGIEPLTHSKVSKMLLQAPPSNFLIKSFGGSLRNTSLASNSNYNPSPAQKFRYNNV